MREGSKIAFVMPWHISERGGGAEVQANYLAQELGERGYSVSYVCQTTHNSKINTINKVGNINVHFLKPSGRFQWLDQNKYLEPLNTIKPDYILQRLSSNVTYVLGKYCSKNKCKFVWFCTDNSNPYRDFLTLKFKERYTMKSLGVIKYIIFALNNKLMDYYRNKGMTKVDIVFSQNNFQKAQLNQNFSLISHRMISGHPIPTNTISTSQRFKNKTILWCANFGAHKRPELFIELARQMQHTALKFVMVGGHSDTAYVNNLLKNKPNNLVTTGYLPFSEALNYFNEASIFVNTSVSEGFSNTYIQAWLRRVPVIVFGADSDNVIETNQLGFNVMSIEESVEKTSATMEDYEAYKILSENAYAYGCQNNSTKVMTDNFLKVIANTNTA